MKVLYCAGTSGNTGPANAERKIVEHWPVEDEIRCLPSVGALGKLRFVLGGLPWCDVVVSCGYGKLGSMIDAGAHALGKPVVGFCHGYAPFENEINNIGMTTGQVEGYVGWLHSLDAVATNSRLQRDFVIEREPSLEGRMHAVMLGVERFAPATRCGARTGHHVVSVSGGTRPIKGNDVVAHAVGILRDRGVDIELRVYGRRYAENSELDELVESCGRYMGQVDPAEFSEGLAETDVFVMDSRHDSFGLSAIDALAAGCSLLLSINCGVKEVMRPDSRDIVHDCENAGEVADKIEALLHEGNCRRLSESIDFDLFSWAAAASRYRNVCLKALEEGGRK